jgi:hypothetical protein
MSCNCNNSTYNNICCPDTPYPQVSHESVPSLIDNLVYALYGTITKTVVNGRVVWNIPCDPTDDPATIDGFPRLLGEGLLCYIIRYFDTLAPALLDVVTISGNQTITGQKTFNWIKLPVGTTATRPTGQTGLVRFNTDRNQFEGYNNTTWSGIGDQPVGGGTNRVFFENDIAMTANYTITSGKNAMSTGPITVNPGVVLTVPSGSVYTIV